eukprot:12570398-Alexandrium_andersonii.AAC.1
MAKPELAGDALGLELWRLLAREREAPEQPAVQREFQKRWAYPKRCQDAAELRARLPNGMSGGARAGGHEGPPARGA